MGLIGDFIDDACRIQPEVMRTVAEHEMGDMASYFNSTPAGGIRGCLIGSVALAGVLRGHGRFSGHGAPFDVWRLTGIEVNEVARVAMAAPRLEHRIYQKRRDRRWGWFRRRKVVTFKDVHADVVTMFKNRIRRTLAMLDAERAAERATAEAAVLNAAAERATAVDRVIAESRDVMLDPVTAAVQARAMAGV